MFSVKKTDLVKEILFMQAHFVKCSRIPTELIQIPQTTCFPLHGINQSKLKIYLLLICAAKSLSMLLFEIYLQLILINWVVSNFLLCRISIQMQFFSSQKCMQTLMQISKFIKITENIITSAYKIIFRSFIFF